MDDRYRSPALLAMRAWTSLDQKTVAAGAGIGERTLHEAEAGRACSEKSWTRLTSFYATRGLHWRDGDAGELGRLLVLTIVAGE